MFNFYGKWKDHKNQMDNRFPEEHPHHLKISMMGPPGSGKSTQAQNISEYYDLPKMSAGDILRNSMDIQVSSRTVGNFLKNGDLVPDTVINPLIEARLENLQKFVLEGYPRNISQAKHLDSIVRLNHIIKLKIPNNELRTRLTGHRVCKNCGSVYHLEYDPPNRVGVCHECGGTLYQREDDRPEAVDHRLNVYRQRTTPAVELSRRRKNFIVVNGEGSPGKVWNRITNLVEPRPLLGIKVSSSV